MNEREQDLENKIEELRNELEQKSDFLSMIVHQLRTPLSANKWIFKMLLDNDLGSHSDEERRIIERGYDANDAMIRLLAEVSNANRLSEWKLQFHPEPSDIARCIDETITEFAAEAHHKDITIHFAHPDPIPLVMADREKVCLVVQNLMENAIKYNRPGGSVTVHAETFQDKLVISVTDTGIGIPESEQANIFKKFFRASNAKKSQKGSGLGLFVGKCIIEAHGGSLWFETAPGIGTTFFFSLPLAQ